MGKQGALAQFPRASQGQSSDRFVDAQFSRDVGRLVKLGPRVVAEFLAEIGRDHLLRLIIEELLQRYIRRLTPEMLRVIGGDRFQSAPIHLVVGGRR
jgi:hypothetical protein